MGRHVNDIMSYPKTSITISEAKFVFRRCVSFAVLDEVHHSISEKALKGDGKTFMRFMSSPQIEAARQGRPDDFRTLHYRLNFQDEIIDVVCSEAPKIELKQMLETERDIAAR
jgi:transposase